MTQHNNKDACEEKVIRTLSNWVKLPDHSTNIIRFMAHESKNIYNAAVFHTRIFLQFSNDIYKELYGLIKAKKIKNVIQFDAKLLEIYDKYYKYHTEIMSLKNNNNSVIFDFIKKELKGIVIVNENFEDFRKAIVNDFESSDLLKFPTNCTQKLRKELFYDVAFNILKNIYNNNFRQTRNEILHKIPCTIKDENFIEQVKNEEHLFPIQNIEPVKYKILIQEHPLFKKKAIPKPNAGSKTAKKPSSKKPSNEIKSNQNYIARIVYKYYQNRKIPSDLMCNIIKKVHEAFSSFFAKLKKGEHGNAPNFLPKNGIYTLPYYARSRSEVTIDGINYYRLTVGSYIADNLPYVVDDNRIVCIHNALIYKKYIDQQYLIKINPGQKINRTDNYIFGNYFIPKNSEHIIDGYYIYVQKPIFPENSKLKLIEISPEYDGYKFKINFTYDVPKTENKPVKGKIISMDLGMKNLIMIYDSNGDQYIIKGKSLLSYNKYINYQIDKARSELSKNNPTTKSTLDIFDKEIDNLFRYLDGEINQIPRKTKNDLHNQLIDEKTAQVVSGNFKQSKKQQKTSKRIRNLLIDRHNKINDFFNKVVHVIVQMYSDSEYIIVGYNQGWKTGVSMGRANNRNFYDIPYRKLLKKLGGALEKNNQKLEKINESYTSKCDPFVFEEVCRHEEYAGQRIKRGLFSSAAGIMVNADLVGAINIQRKWKLKRGEEMEEITGNNLCNPKILNIYEECM